MSGVTSRLVFAAIVVAFGAQSALAGDRATRGYHTSRGNFHHLYMSYRSPWYAPSPDAALRTRIRLPRPRARECD